jgi:hypothetical protein
MSEQTPPKDPKEAPKKPAGKSGKPDEDKLAAALRANLKRRKQAARDKKDD